MLKIKVINGPNLNMLGIREPSIYGNKTYKDLISYIEDFCEKEKIDVTFFQSNNEGEIVTEIQNCLNLYDGIVLNAGAYTHYSYAIYDAILSANVPTCEVHISDINNRKEDWRKISVIRDACVYSVSGHGFNGYIEAISFLKNSKG